MVLLDDLSQEFLFKKIELGVDETLYIRDIIYSYSLTDVGSVILNNELNKLIRVKFSVDFLDEFNDFNINDKISVNGCLRLNTDDLLYVEVDKILNHVPNYIDENINDSIDNGFVDDSILRSDPRVNEWRIKVLNRDKVCQCCGGEKHLEAHHIFSWEDYPDLRVDVNNGVALCKWCHHRYNSYFGHKGTGIGMVKYLNKFSGK